MVSMTWSVLKIFRFRFQFDNMLITNIVSHFYMGTFLKKQKILKYDFKKKYTSKCDIHSFIEILRKLDSVNYFQKYLISYCFISLKQISILGIELCNIYCVLWVCDFKRKWSIVHFFLKHELIVTKNISIPEY